jgi:glyoxylase-like metal-dependent hydrolase (beta-lactamase superfamily II)
MIVQVFPSGPFETNAYLVACPYTNRCAVIDPAPGCFEMIKRSIKEKGYLPQTILLTHSHWDHIADTEKFKQLYGCPVYIHPLDTPNLESPGADQLPCWISFPGMKADGFLVEGTEVCVGNLRFSVIHTPGHSPGSVCLYCQEENILFSGDTLFKGTIGNLSFPTSCPDLMWPSLKKLAILPKETIVYPGHGPSTVIKSEPWLNNAKDLFEHL